MLDILMYHVLHKHVHVSYSLLHMHIIIRASVEAIRKSLLYLTIYINVQICYLTRKLAMPKIKVEITG